VGEATGKTSRKVAPVSFSLLYQYENPGAGYGPTLPPAANAHAVNTNF